MELHYLENADGQLLAQAMTKAQLPKIKGAVHNSKELEPYQARMLEDGLPLFLLMTQDQRAAAWRANPPKAVPGRQSVGRERELALAAERAKLAKEQAALAAALQATQRATKVVPVDTTGKRWNWRKGNWEPDPYYNPQAPKQAKPIQTSPIPEASEDASQKLKILVKANPRKAGTKAHEKWNDLAAFLKRKPDCTVADVFANTTYQKIDLNWDVAKKSIKIINP